MPRKKKTAEPTQTYQVTLQIVGPILRQIIDDSPRPRREVALEHVSLWATATQLHLIRFRRSLGREFALLGSKGPVRGIVSQRVRIDEHMLLASASNLDKALRLFAGEVPELKMPPALTELLRHLRNVYEHWEDYMPHVAKPGAAKSSGKALKALHPEAHFWAIEIWPDGDVKIARVLSLRDLHANLRTLVQRLRKLI